LLLDKKTIVGLSFNGDDGRYPLMCWTWFDVAQIGTLKSYWVIIAMAGVIVDGGWISV